VDDVRCSAQNVTTCGVVAAIAVACVVAPMFTTTAAAQTPIPPPASRALPTHPIEVSFLVPAVRFGDLDPFVEWQKEAFPADRHAPLASWTEAGGGLRFGYRFTRGWSVEAEGSLFRTYADGPDLTDPPDPFYRGWRKITVLAGVKAGVPLGAATVFGTVRPGFVRFGRFPRITEIEPLTARVSQVTVVDDGPATFPAIGLGGGVEALAGARWLVRGDLADVLIWCRPAPRDLNPSFVRHTLVVSGSFGVRF
jgi:hypothetical protein